MMTEFQDEYIPQLKLNASKIMYVATANSLHGIPDAILSRFHIIYINPPDKSQLRIITKSIYQSVLESESYTAFSKTLNEDVIDCLMSYSPRQIKVILKLAFASAAYRCRYGEQFKAIAIEVIDLDLPEAQLEKQIGFVW